MHKIVSEFARPCSTSGFVRFDKVPEDHHVAGAEEARRYIEGTDYPGNSDYILFARELDLQFGLGGKRVLELCCGPGGLTAEIGRYSPSALVAIDGSEDMIAHCRSTKGRSGAEFVLYDMFAIPPAMGGFDLAVCQNSIHHFPPKRLAEFIERALSTLRKGGVFYASDYRRKGLKQEVLEERLLSTNPHIRLDLVNTLRAAYTEAEILEICSRISSPHRAEVFLPGELYAALREAPDYREIVARDPHPHHLDYELSLRIRLTRE